MTTFQAIPASWVPGDNRVQLTAEWGSIPPGTYVRPLCAGRNNTTNRHERTVTIVSGERSGETITGPF